MLMVLRVHVKIIRSFGFNTVFIRSYINDVPSPMIKYVIIAFIWLLFSCYIVGVSDLPNLIVQIYYLALYLDLFYLFVARVS